MARVTLTDYLETEGFCVLSARSGEEAIELLSGDPCHVAIVDIRLPGMDGNAFVQRASGLDPAMRFVIHTGYSSYYLPDELKALGISPGEVFYKPVSSMKPIGKTVINLLCENGNEC